MSEAPITGELEAIVFMMIESLTVLKTLNTHL